MQLAPSAFLALAVACSDLVYQIVPYFFHSFSIPQYTSFDEKDLNGDDGKVKFYTGLPTYATLMAIFNFVSTHIPVSSSASLSNFQQFLIVLMKLRLNLFDKDLAYRFGISQPSVSRYFRKWIDIMFLQLQPLVKWPGRELQLMMPVTFRK